jgi:hypothetical protein
MPEKLTQIIDGIFNSAPGLLLMTSQVDATIRQIFLAMLIVAIPSGVVMYAGVRVLESDLQSIKQEQKQAEQERDELFRMHWQHTGNTSLHRIDIK